MKISYPGAPVVESLPSLDKTVHWFLNGCPRCGGDLFQQEEFIKEDKVPFMVCLQCGFRVNKWP